VATAAAVALLLVGQASPQPPVVASGVELVRLDVVAVDRAGRPVSGLHANDFEVREEGRLQRITSFESVIVTRSGSVPSGPRSATPRAESAAQVAEPSEGRHILIFFDDVHLSSTSAERVRAQLIPCLLGEVQEGDWITIVAPERGLNWTARNVAEYQLLPAVMRQLSGQYVRDPFHGSIGEWEAMQAVEGRLTITPRAAIPPRAGQRDQAAPSGSSAIEIYEIAQRRIRKTLAVLQRAVESLTSLPGHKELLLVSEGFILAPPLAEYYNRVIDAARRAQVAVSFINPEGVTSGLPQAADSSQPATKNLSPAVELEGQIAGARFVSAATGGRDYGSNDLTPGLRTAFEESSVYYLLGYEPPTAGDNLRKVQVSILRDGLHVRARERYFLKRIGPERQPVERAVEAVADEKGLMLSVRAQHGPVDRGETETTLMLTVGSPADSAGTRSFKVRVQARRLEGGILDYKTDARPSGPAPSQVQVRGLRLKPGHWQIRVVVQDERSGALGSVLLPVELPARF
jgi:VWFA-related protein